MGTKPSQVMLKTLALVALIGVAETAGAVDKARPLPPAPRTGAGATLNREDLEQLADPAPVFSAGGIEVVRERYPDGKTKIERQVVLDDTGNYVNPGEWKWFAPTGNILAQGSFEMGKRIGPWSRWQSAKDTPMLNEFPFRNFRPPFHSSVNFVNDQMEGEWLIVDSAQRKCALVSLVAGKRHGASTLWLPNGSVYSQATYERGIPTGDVLEYDRKTGQAKRVATYVEGRKLTTNTVKGRNPKHKKSEEQFLEPKTVEHSADDFWSMKFAEYSAEGPALRHGPSKLWFDNGQIQQEGNYQYGKKTGTFTFYFETGQVAATGEYRDDQPDDVWVWWHRNGQKATVGKYRAGHTIGEWRWWNEDGTLANQMTYEDAPGLVAEPEQLDQELETGMAPVPLLKR
jgi:antitoxin component YwqK of YwqJK toxin-antitoxin module